MPSSDESYRVGMVIPLQGPAGIFGPSCEALAELGAAEVNKRGGILGRQVCIEVIDGGAPHQQLAEEVSRLLNTGRIDAITGWHISSVRETLKPLTSGRIPYVYTSLYEGGEHTPGVFCSGEVPSLQIAPALSWFRDNFGLRRWCIVGSDYVWPYKSARSARHYIRELGLTLMDEVFLPFGSSDFIPAVNRVARAEAQGVLMLLVGQDAVLFNRQFAAHGLSDTITRFSPLMEENMLLASGPNATHNLYAAAGYFNSMATAGALDLMDVYVAANGPDGPPLNNAAESCYEGVLTLESLHLKAGSTEHSRLMEAAGHVGYDGPRGTMDMINSNLRQQVHLAVAQGNDFDVIGALSPLPE